MALTKSFENRIVELGQDDLSKIFSGLPDTEVNRLKEMRRKGKNRVREIDMKQKTINIFWKMQQAARKSRHNRIQKLESLRRQRDFLRNYLNTVKSMPRQLVADEFCRITRTLACRSARS